MAVADQRILVLERNHHDLGGHRLLDRLLTVLVAAPRRLHVAAVLAERAEDPRAVVGLADLPVERLLRGRVQLRVDLVEMVLDGGDDVLPLLDDAHPVGAVNEGQFAVLDLVGTDLDPERNAVEFVLVELEPGIALVAVVEFDADLGGIEVVRDALGVLEHVVHGVLLPDRDDDDLRGGHPRRKHQSLLVRVGHDQRAERAPRDPPRGRVRESLVLVLVGERDVERLGERLAEMVGGRALHGLPVRHQGLDGRRRVRARELVVGGLLSLENGDRQQVLVHRLVLVEPHHGLVPRVVRGRVCGVALLPEELLRAEEGLRLRRLPAHDRAPLVHAQRQVAVAPHPLADVGGNDRLRGWADGEALLELLRAGLGHPRDLGVEPLDDVLLAFEVRLGDEHGEVGVLDPRIFELRVEEPLQTLPDGVGARAGDDESAHPVGAVVGQSRLLYDLGVPLAGVV